MKAKFRTPRKILSVFLCILMLTTSVVIANPFTASAVRANGYIPTILSEKSMLSSRSSSKVYSNAVLHNFEDDYETEGHLSGGWQDSEWYYEIAYYDCNPTNVTKYVPYVDYDVRSYDERYSGTAYYDTDSCYVSPDSAETGISDIYVPGSYLIGVEGESINDEWNYFDQYGYLPVKVYVYNTETLYELYDYALEKYGKENVVGYNDSAWNNYYIPALNKVENLINDGIHYRIQGETPQKRIYDAQNGLRDAMKLLTPPIISIGNVFQSVEGGIISGPIEITVGENFTVTVTLSEGYTQSAPRVAVSYNGAATQYFTGTKTSDNTYTYTIKVSRKDVNKITPVDVNKNVYKLTIPSGATGLEVLDGKGGKEYNITHGESFNFRIKQNTGYTNGAPVVKVNGKQIGGVANDDNTIYSYAIDGIKENKQITIDGKSLNTYNIGYSLGEGVSAASDSASSINHFGTATIKLTVDAAHSQNAPAPSVSNGTITYVSKDEATNTYTYELKDVTADTTVTVPALAKNTYPVTLPSGIGYSASCDTTIYDLDAIEHGTYLAFAVALDEQYNRSVPVVKYNGTLLEPTDGGIYTVKVTNEIKPGEITVENVDLNRYYITLPLETETGFTIIVGEGQNAKSVPSGSDFDFKFFLDPAYSDSNPVIKYSADGGDHYSVLTEADGKYTIEDVLSDCIVVVEGVKKNTYTVNFTDEKGESIKQYTDVEYGTEVVFDGTEPTKASEKLDEYEEDGNTVIITKEYKFIGWSADTSYVTSNMTVTPIFEVSEVKTTKPADGGDDIVIVTPKTANILFVSGGVIVHKETVTKGESFTGWDGTPVKTSSNPYETYTFIGWDTDRDGVVDYAAGESNAIADVQNDITFTAVFESNLPSKTVNYYNFDGTELLYSASIKCGEKAEYGLSAIPSRTDNTNTYDFAGWAFTTDADETEVVEKLIVGENNIDLYAAYKKTPIVYSYKYVDYDYDKVTGEPEPFQEGSFYYGDRYKYLGSTPTRASTVSTDYAFDGWDVAQSGYDTIYTATYAESVREYTSNLPTADGTYTITDNATIPYGDTFSFTVTVADGYEETEPNVTTASDETLTPVSTDGNSYTYEIKLDGATAEEVNGDLTVTVKTTINNYDVSIGGDAGCEVVPTEINSTHGGSGSFIVTLKEGYTQNAPTITSDGKVTVKLESNEGNKYVYSVTGIKSDAEIKVATKINEYKVVMVNYDGEKVFEGTLKHGETPAYENPSKPTDKFGGYTFIGWDTDGDGDVDVTAIANVTGDISAKAVYECNHVHAEDPTADGTAWVLVSTDKATCTTDGVRHYKCSYEGCTETKDWTIKARGHKMGEYTVTLAPTCTKDGSKIHYCENAETEDYAKCDHSATAVVPKLGHAYGEWKTVVEPTCTEKGKAERVCANDPGHKEYKDVPATGHHDSDDDYVCDDCGDDLGHCSKCICHKGNILSKVLRYICTLLTKTFHKPIKCCKDMEWYGDKISSIS